MITRVLWFAYAGRGWFCGPSVGLTQSQNRAALSPGVCVVPRGVSVSRTHILLYRTALSPLHTSLLLSAGLQSWDCPSLTDSRSVISDTISFVVSEPTINQASISCCQKAGSEHKHYRAGIVLWSIWGFPCRAFDSTPIISAAGAAELLLPHTQRATHTLTQAAPALLEPVLHYSLRALPQHELMVRRGCFTLSRVTCSHKDFKSCLYPRKYIMFCIKNVQWRLCVVIPFCILCMIIFFRCLSLYLNIDILVVDSKSNFNRKKTLR